MISADDLDWKKYAPSAKDLASMAHRKGLAVGEPWTFIAKDDEEAAVYASKAAGDRVSVWWSTAEAGRLFLITRVHERALETTFLGFAYSPGSFTTEAEYLKEAEAF